MRIDTEAKVLHDCRCYIGISPISPYPGGTRPKASGFYRGFIWHCWSWPRERSPDSGFFCLLPVEMTSDEAGKIMELPSTATHKLGNGEQVRCMFPLFSLTSLKEYIDYFWQEVLDPKREKDIVIGGEDESNHTWLV